MKIKTYRFAAAVAVLLALALVFVAPVAADKIYYVSQDGSGDGSSSSSPGSLSDILSSITDDTETKYIIYLLQGDYTSSYSITYNTRIVDIVFQPVENAVVNFTNTITINGDTTHDVMTSSSVTFRGLNFILSNSVSTGILIPGEMAELRTLIVDSCTFTGVYDGTSSTEQNAIDVKRDNRLKVVKLLNTNFEDVSHPFGGYFNYADDEFVISGCIINNAKSGINIQSSTESSAGIECVIKIEDNTITATGYCIRFGSSGSSTGDVIITDNILTVTNPSDTDHGAVVLRGKTVEDISISGNAMTGNILLNFGDMSSDGSVGDINLDGNYWNGDDEPFAEDSTLINWGSAVDENQKPSENVIIYTELNEDGTINKNPTPSQPATPSSSSSGTPTPGAYYNYPRTVTDGGLVEFGTSKVVKSVTLPAGSSGKVNLHIDSTAYWPLSLDSEFTFDISVDNLGEGTSYISFKIAESKLTALELTAADVGVYHNVNGEWVKLVVTYTIEDGDVIYTAETDSFSPFKLVIEEGAAVQKEEVTPSEPVVDEPVTPDVPQDVPGEVLPEIPDIQDEPEEPSSPAPVLGLIAALGAAVVLRRK